MNKVLMFSGSSRKESVNQKLIRAAANYASSQGAEVTVINLADYPMPLYNGDLEETDGIPPTVKELTALLASHNSIFISSPEHNGLPSALLKNTIDWVSREDISVFSGKVAAIVSASPGGLGGLRGLPHLRTLLNNINSLVIPQQASIGGALHAFDENGNLAKDNQREMLEKVVNGLLNAHIS
jgi:chromate reductase